MLVFASEFPAAAGRTLEDLLRVAQTWLAGGRRYSWDSPKDVPLGDGEIIEDIRSGQHVWTGLLREEGRSLGGLRHSWVEDGAREWISEITGLHQDDALWVSVRLSCLLRAPAGAAPPTPKKPHVIKQVFQALGGGNDGPLSVRDKPHYLHEPDLPLATQILRGEADCNLPVAYVSCDFHSHPSIDVGTVAKWLAGVAHVVVEPNRTFSVKLAATVGRRNPYGGVVGVHWPGGGRHDRLYPSQYNNSTELALDLQERLRRAWLYTKTGRGITWAEVREASSRLRIDDLKRTQGTDVDDYAEAFDEENAALRERAQQAEAQVSGLKEALRALQAQAASGEGGVLQPGEEQEFYPGELLDVVLATLKDAQSGTTEGSRRRVLLDDLLSANAPSGQQDQLETDIKAVLSNTKKITARDLRTLKDAGFTVEDGGKHYKLTFADDPRFAFSLFKTASDYRSGKNLASQIIKKLLRP